MFERCLCSELVFWFDIRCCIVYYIIYYIIHIIYYILYLYYILYIISYTISYIILLYLILYSSSLLSFLFYPSSSQYPLPLQIFPSQPHIHSILVGTWICLFIFFYLSILSFLSHLPNLSSVPFFCSQSQISDPARSIGVDG